MVRRHATQTIPKNVFVDGPAEGLYIHVTLLKDEITVASPRSTLRSTTTQITLISAIVVDGLHHYRRIPKSNNFQYTGTELNLPFDNDLQRLKDIAESKNPVRRY